MLGLVLALALSDVQQIQISSSVSTPSGPSNYTTTIVPKGGAFTSGDGRTISAKAVRALLDALSSAHREHADPADLGLTPAALRSRLPLAERCLGTPPVPQARTQFDRVYLDPSELRSAMDDATSRDPQTPNTTYALDLSVTTSTKKMFISSESQRPMMLPFTISVDGHTRSVYDGALVRAIGALLPPAAPNAASLSNDALFLLWEVSACQDPSVRTARESFGHDAAAHAAARYGLQLRSYQNYDARTWTAQLSHPGGAILDDLPVTTHGAPGNTDAAMHASAARIDRVAKIEWLAEALHNDPNGRIEILAQRGVFPQETQALNDAGRTRVADYVKHNADNALWLSMHSGSADASSQWFLFPDGTMILESFANGMSAFPFEGEGYAMATHRIPRPDRDRTFVGLFVDANGVVENDQ